METIQVSSVIACKHILIGNNKVPKCATNHTAQEEPIVTLAIKI